MDVLLRKHRLLFSEVCFSLLLFFYFLSSSGEQLHAVVGVFKPKIGHLVALLLLGWIFLERKPWSFPRPLLKPSLLILGSLAISALCSVAKARSLGYIGVYLLNFGFYFFLPFQILQTIDLNRFFRIYWGSFLIVGLYAALQVGLSIFGIYAPFTLQKIGSLARGQAWTYEPSYYALYMVPYVMFHNGIFLLQEGRLRFKSLKLFGQNMLLAVSTSTGLIVSYPVFFGVVLFATFTKFLRSFQSLLWKNLKKAILAFSLSVGLFTALFYEITLHSLFKFFYFGIEHLSFVARWDGIVASTKVFLTHPLLGVGLGGVGPYLFQKESLYDLKITTLEEFEAHDPTNCLTEILASLGLIGLIAFISLAALFHHTFRDVIEDISIDAFSKKTAIALFFSLIVMVIALQMNQGLFRPYIWIHAAVVYGYLYRLKSFSIRGANHLQD